MRTIEGSLWRASAPEGVLNTDDAIVVSETAAKEELRAQRVYGARAGVARISLVLEAEGSKRDRFLALANEIVDAVGGEP